MFYKIKVTDHIRVPPKIFDLSTEEAVIQRIKKKYDGFISKDLGVVIDVADVTEVGDGLIITGDGASYFDTTFELLTYKPELQEVVLGNIRDIADFGAFMSVGPIEGMIHVSQTMDDFVSFSKDKVLSGKESKQTLKVGDKCRARMVAVSYKDVSNPKLGLTMRQEGLGKLEWIEDRKKASAEPKAKKEDKKEDKKK
ncbi:DNA-directed RNA polymerase [Candidatus Woesearchaeota archaeon]|mgnify:CR=1 FL=1|jgi:DNA-directed RNA polymerase subunit E'|nr:DNA-directed RNA polymerase [Candidatus Woesearchaeota archaeon]MBT6519194.1 DNA-directed RNA polymerase [Candidatus Woesearchaeota archaeon]MBT7367648.1 DNA-directed RNA polymerase [Candidatus Woesearchaeota archaeon]